MLVMKFPKLHRYRDRRGRAGLELSCSFRFSRSLSNFARNPSISASVGIVLGAGLSAVGAGAGVEFADSAGFDGVAAELVDGFVFGAGASVGGCAFAVWVAVEALAAAGFALG